MAKKKQTETAESAQVEGTLRNAGLVRDAPSWARLANIFKFRGSNLIF